MSMSRLLQLERKIQEQEEALGIRPKPHTQRSRAEASPPKVDSLAAQVDSRNRRIAVRKLAHANSRNRTREIQGLPPTDDDEPEQVFGIQPSSRRSALTGAGSQIAKKEVSTSEFASRIAASINKHKVRKPAQSTIKLGKLWDAPSDQEGSYLDSLRRERQAESESPVKSQSQLEAEQRVAALRIAKARRQNASALATRAPITLQKDDSEMSAAERFIRPFGPEDDEDEQPFGGDDEPAFQGEFIACQRFRPMDGYVFKAGSQGLGLYWDGSSSSNNSSNMESDGNAASSIFASSFNENRARKERRSSVDLRSTDRMRMAQKMAQKMQTKTATGPPGGLHLSKALAAAQRRPSMHKRENHQKAMKQKFAKPGKQHRTAFLQDLYS